MNAAVATAPPGGEEVTSGLKGVVRSYNGSKGFGFITGEGAFSDVMFSRFELPEDAREVRGNFMESRAVSFDAIIKPDGRAKATAVSIPQQADKPSTGIIKIYSHEHQNGLVQSHALPGVEVRFRLEDFTSPIHPSAELKGGLVLFESKFLPDGKCVVTKIQFQTHKIAEKYGGMDFDRGKGGGKGWGWGGGFGSSFGGKGWGCGYGPWQPMFQKWKGKGDGKGQRRIEDPTKAIWVGGLPAGSTYQALKAHAESVGVPALWAEVHNNKVGGTGAIGFKTAEEAHSAIVALNGSVFDGASLQTDTWQQKQKEPS